MLTTTMDAQELVFWAERDGLTFAFEADGQLFVTGKKKRVMKRWLPLLRSQRRDVYLVLQDRMEAALFGVEEYVPLPVYH